MKKIILLLTLAATAPLCGCNQQAKINSAKIDILAQKIVQLEQAQSKELTALQTQMAALAPMLDKMNDFYFEKNHDEAFFFHTNTLFLVLTVGNRIESQLQTADTERAAQNARAYGYYTNQLRTIYLSVAEIQEALTASEGQIEAKVNAETKSLVADLTAEMQNQIRLVAPDNAEIARRKALAADLAQIKSELAQIKTQLAQPPSSTAK